MKNRGMEVYADRFQADPGLEKVVIDGYSRWKFSDGEQAGGG